MTQTARYYIDFVYDEVAKLKELGLDKKAYSDTLDADGKRGLNALFNKDSPRYRMPQDRETDSMQDKSERAQERTS